MSFLLPPQGSRARELMGDVAHVAEILDPRNVSKLVGFRSAIMQGERTAKELGVSRVSIICLRADDERWLISVGRRGGWQKVWNFGNGNV